MTFGSLFAGIGGIDLGLERAGMECRWQVENDPYCQRVLAKHWPDAGRWDDVCTFPPNPAEDWHVDGITAGFPCQDISYAGHGAGLEGERSGLFFETVRVVEQLRPRWVLLENVAALLTRGLDVVCGTLAEVGYDSEWHCIPASAFGAHFRRDRVFIVAGRPVPNCLRRQGEWTGKTRAWSEQQFAGLVEHQLSVCVPAGKTHRVSDGISHRTHRLRALGNAVVPQVAEWLGRRIMEANI